MDTVDCRESSLKELPTRELKLKRHKSRRDSPTIPPIRLRLKSNASSLNSETDMEKCLSDRSVSSSPDSVGQELSPVFISTSHKVTCEINSSSSSPITNDSYDAFNFHTSTYVENEDNDQPLDMSRKRTEYTGACTVDLSRSQQQQLRPSVITCASALLRTQCSLTDIPHNKCTIKANCDSNCNDIEDNHCINHHQLNKSNSKDELKVAHIGPRQEIVSGSCDPVIDEHFRRSLGKDYQNIFSKSSSNNVSITVDDHFAKALGETWHQLQQSKVTSEVSAAHASNVLQNQTTPQFLHSAPEILL